MPRTHVAPHRGAPTLFVDGQPVFPAEYWPGWGPPQTPEQREEYRRAGELGLHVYNTAIFAETWVGPGQFDFSQLEAKFGLFVEVDPEALFHIRMPIEAPGWWRQAHPEECEVFENGERFAQSFASEVWRRDACELLRAYIEFVRGTWIGQRVVAYHPCACPWQEWGTYNSMYDLCSDYSEPMQRHFRAWLGARYGDSQALQEAWQDATVGLETATVPPPEVQRACGRRTFRDPRADRRAIDYLECLNACIAGDIVQVCAACQEACQGGNIVGVFYGYLMEMAWSAGFFYGAESYPYSAYARSGHLALPRLLESPHLDFFASPLSYGFRHVGGDAPFMTLHDSIKAHGKIYFAEDDCRSHLTGPTNPDYGAPKTAADAVSIYRRNFANTLCRSSGIWWLGGESAASTLDEDLRACLAEFVRIGRASMRVDRGSAAQIAVVVDDRSLLYKGFRKDLEWSAIFLQRHFGLARLGAPHDLWLLDDLVEGVAPPYRMYLFLDAWAVDERQRRGLRQHVLRDGALAVWGFASGVTDTRTFAAAHIGDLTGIRVREAAAMCGHEAVITNHDHPITRSLPSGTHWGTPADLGPSFEVDDPEAVVLGIVVTGNGRCEPGVAYRDLGSWRSLYVGAPNLPANVLRQIARFAGVHVYSEVDDVLYANHSFVGLHTVKGETKRIALPDPRPVYEVYTHRQLAAEPVTAFADHVEARQTRLYFLGRGEELA
ncbi:MAG: beta-galactosidase [Candidatus Latescibacterota bacterium]